MRNVTVYVLTILALFAFGTSAFAENRIIEVWQCKLKEGKTAKELHGPNGKWLAFVNSRVKGGGIRSFVMTSIVGNPGEFHYADSYPSMEAWVAAKAAIDTPEGQAVEAALEADATCSANTLQNSEES